MDLLTAQVLILFFAYPAQAAIAWMRGATKISFLMAIILMIVSTITMESFGQALGWRNGDIVTVQFFNLILLTFASLVAHIEKK